MVIIYLIEDKNGLKYVGSTCHALARRLSNHRSEKKRKKYSSHQLDLDNCEISLIEECSDDIRMEREAYHIQHTDCVNQMRYDFDSKAYMCEYNKTKGRDNNRRYREKHLEKRNQESKKYYSDNLQKRREYNKNMRIYQNSWGGNPRYNNNNLLLISVDLFQ